jgi:hypothetical protein
VDHPEQLALAGVVDDGVGGELTARRDRHVFGTADEVVDVVRRLLVIQQTVDHLRWRLPRIASEFFRARAEPHAAQHVLEQPITPGHTAVPS